MQLLLYYKLIEDIIKNIIVFFGEFMSWDEVSNDRKLEYTEILFLYIYANLSMLSPLKGLRIQWL
jgi:hypothetical protein